MSVVDKKIRVALMTYAFDGRRAMGTALYARKLTEKLLTDKRFEFFLVHYEPSNDPIYKGVNEIIMPRVKLPFGSHFVSQLLFFWQQRKQPFDIVHWFQPRIYPFFWLAPARKIVVTTHGAGDITAPGHFVLSRFIFNKTLIWFNSKVNAFLADSIYGKQEIIDHYRAKSNKTFFTYLGGGEDFMPLNKEQAWSKVKKYNIHKPFILEVARMLPHKNVISVVKAYLSLRAQLQQEIDLVVVGSDQSEGQKIKELASNSNYASDIHFINYVESEDLNAFYSAASVFVFPSLQEGFGLPLIEAMAAGTPVITSNVTSLPEIVGQAGLVVSPLDIEALSQAMKIVLTDQVLANNLRELGLKRAQEFSWSKTALKTADIYLQLCN